MRSYPSSALKVVLEDIIRYDKDYKKRYSLVLEAMYLADKIGLETGYRIDPNEPEWPVAYIQLGTKQVSWHMPQFPYEYDNHTTEEKIAWMKEWIAK